MDLTSFLSLRDASDMLLMGIGAWSVLCAAVLHCNRSERPSGVEPRDTTPSRPYREHSVGPSKRLAA